MSTYKKLVIVLAGGGAVGKTTTTKAFANGEPVEHVDKREITSPRGVRMENIHWTVYKNCALTGNHHSGTDSNAGPYALEEAFKECAKVRDIIIIDGYVSTSKWAYLVNDWIAAHPDFQVQVLIVHFKISPEEMLQRLAKRRGVDVESIREKYLPTRAEIGHRGDATVNVFWKYCKCHVVVVELSDADTTDEIVELIDEEVDAYFA